MTDQVYDAEYYAAHHTVGDRIALWYYARVIRRLRPRGGRLLDFGCGTGHLLKRLEGLFETYGYDPSTYAREHCRIHAPRSTVLADWHDVELTSLEVIAALHSLEHLEQPREVVPELARRLRPGGLLFAVVPNPGGVGHWLKGRNWFGYRDPTHHSLLRYGQWLQVFREASLEVVSVRGDGLWDSPYVGVLPTSVQRVVFGAPAALQIFAPVAAPFLPASFGECLVVQAVKR